MSYLAAGLSDLAPDRLQIMKDAAYEARNEADDAENRASMAAQLTGDIPAYYHAVWSIKNQLDGVYRKFTDEILAAYGGKIPQDPTVLEIRKVLRDDVARFDSIIAPASSYAANGPMLSYSIYKNFEEALATSSEAAKSAASVLKSAIDAAKDAADAAKKAKQLGPIVLGAGALLLLLWIAGKS